MTCCGVSSALVPLILTLSVVSGVTSPHASSQIITSLTGPWNSTSPLHEAAEFLHDVCPNLFWSFVHTVFEQLDDYPALQTDDEEVSLATLAAFSHLSPVKLRLLQWSLTSRIYSPRVLMLQQLGPAVPDHKTSHCEDDDAFVVINGQRIVCSLVELKTVDFSGSSLETMVDADHKYPSHVWTKGLTEHSSPELPTVVLYGALRSKKTRDFHEYLKAEASNLGAGYILRLLRPESGSGDPISLSGYGVELQFKSTEYVAQDDSGKVKDESIEVAGFAFDKLHELHPDLSEELDRLQNHLTSARGKKAEFEALKAWQVQELGLQAAYSTMLDKDKFLETLLDVSGNFPSRAASLSALKVSGDFKRNVANNQRLIQAMFNIEEGEGAFFLQGQFIDPESLDIFTFIETLKGEMELMEILRAVLHQEESLVTRSQIDNVLAIGGKTSAEPEMALDLRDSSVFWMNDLEKDDEYEDWPDDLTQLFFRMGGVMLRPVRRNVFNLLLTLDSSDVPMTSSLLKLAHSFMTHKAPVRIGLVFCPSTSEALQNDDIIRRVLNKAVTDERLRSAFADIVSAFEGGNFEKLDNKWDNPGEEFSFGKDLSCDLIRKSGRASPAAFLNGVPLKWDSLDDFEEVVLNQLLREAQVVQIDAYNGRVGTSTDIFDYLMSRPHVQTRLNERILDMSTSTYLSFGTEPWEPGRERKNPNAALTGALAYLTGGGRREQVPSVTTLILCDIMRTDGLDFLKSAVDFLIESATHSRIAFIPTGPRDPFVRSVLRAFQEKDATKVRSLLATNSHPTSIETDPTEDVALQTLEQKLIRSIGLGTGEKAVVVNGRVIGGLRPSEHFDLGDWALVERFTHDGCPKHLDTEQFSTADAMMRMCSVLTNPSMKSRAGKRYTLPNFEDPFVLEAAKKDAFYTDLTAVLDPASRSAHKMASIMSAVRSLLGQWVRIQVLFNTPAKHSELPLKSYFRFNAGDKPGAPIEFQGIPKDPIFTQNFIAPDNWMVEVITSANDLDNIRLRDSGQVTSEYVLDHLLVEGHCLELKTGSPPRGLQFTLTPTTTGGKPAETIVMANLGYFQLKAAPGLWSLSLRDGPSKDIFSLESEQKTKSVIVSSFQSVVLKVKVKRNPGKETASVLDSEVAEDGRSGSWFGFGTKPKDSEDDVLNIFSVASGHLYERLLRIMMLSVLKNTKTRVKFWFLKNYLSPSLKDVLPAMAEEYGFEYELVQYHWPRWLNPQREKQRIIWGYKILFLDVLFPLSLKKIVFVDADQVVRTDMKELFELDLEGNPYGYTPFCDSREEMEGFRFWKKGYWKSHLGKRRYHISALYVVDLVRFRKVAAGDRLRGQYQALSQDPNSLSNLDQDLPNNMIHQVGIKSLPQEWLWCETWCDNASKKQAKTIDLCNNPQTKEPKLDAARRIVSEWDSYDQEVRAFQTKLSSGKVEAQKQEQSRDEL